MSDNSDDTPTLLAYLLVAGVAAAGAKRVWSTTLRPWVDSTWVQLADTTNTATVFAGMDRVDLIGLALMVGPALVVIALLARRARRRRKAAHEEVEA